MKLSDLNPKDYTVEKPSQGKKLKLSDLNPEHIKLERSISNEQPVAQAAPAELPSELQSALLGAEQGLSFGFADELKGGIQSPSGAMKTLLEKLGMDYSQDPSALAYKQARDAARQQYEVAEQTNPWSYTGGNVAGSLLPGGLIAKAVAPAVKGLSLASGMQGPLNQLSNLQRLGNAVKVGGAGGAAYGAGISEADSLGGLAKDVLQTGAIGAGTGFAVEGGLQAGKGVVHGLQKIGESLGQTRTAQNFKNAFGFGKEGVDLVTQEGLESAQHNAREMAKQLGLTSKEALDEAGAAIGKARQAARESGKTISAEEEIIMLQDVIKKLQNSDNPYAIKDVQTLQSYLDNLLLGKEVEVPVQYNKFKPAKPSSEEILSLEASKAKANASALGQNLNTQIIPQEDEAGRKLLTLLKSSDENIGASERAIPVMDDMGNVISEQLSPGDLSSNFKSSASAKTLLDVPASDTKGELVTKTLKYRPGGIDPKEVGVDKAQDIIETLNNLTGVSGSPKLETNEAINMLKRAAGGVDSKVNAVTDIGGAKEQSHKLFQAFKTLGIDPNSDFVKDSITKQKGLTFEGEQKLTDLVKRTARETDAGDKASERLKKTFGYLKNVSPEKAAPLEKQIGRTSEILDLAQKAQQLGILNKSTYTKAGAVQLGNRLGFGAKAISESSKKIGSDLYNVTPEFIRNMASDLGTLGNTGAKISGELMKSINKDQIGRNAVIFSLMQDPAYREILKAYMGDDSGRLGEGKAK